MLKTCSLILHSLSQSVSTHPLSLSLSHTHLGLAPGCSSLGELSLLRKHEFSFLYNSASYIYTHTYTQATIHGSEIPHNDVKPGCERLGKVSV